MARFYGLVVLLMVCLGASADITVTDDYGNEVRLANPAQRIIALAPHLTELLFQLELGDKIVGVVEFSDFPPEAKNIQRVGNAFAVSVEAIVNLEPDLVVAWGSGGSGEQLRKLRSLGIPIYYNEPKHLADVADSMQRIAALAGEDQIGMRFKSDFNSELAKLENSVSSKFKPRVFFQISSSDLYTVNDSHLIGQAISLCGGVNIFGSLRIPVPLVSTESIYVGQPQVIIRSSVEGEKSDWREKWTGNKQIPAVSAGYLYDIPADLISRPSFRMLTGIGQLCNIIFEVAAATAD